MRGALGTVGTIAMKLSAEALDPHADANRSAAQNVFETLSCMTESTDVVYDDLVSLILNVTHCW
jgi:hypothetical protein